MPGLVSCPRRLIVIVILTLSFVNINSEIWSNEVSDVQFGPLDSSVTLTCKAARGGSPVQWRQNGSAVRARPAQVSRGSITLLNATRSMEGNYSCHDQRGALLQSIRLRLGHPPGYVNISCRLPNHFKIECSWAQRVVTYLPTKYISSYSVDGSLLEPCKQERSDVNQCTIHDPMLWRNRHVVNITEVNPLGSMSTLTLVDVHKSFKPEAPEAVAWMEVRGEPTQLLIEWEPPASWPADQLHTFPLKFELEYRPVGSKFWSKLETENTSVLIMDALMGHMHLIRVRAMDAFINHSQWSEWSQVVRAKPWSDLLTNTEEPTVSYLDGPLFPSTFPVKATEKSAEPSLDENLGLLITLGLFAAVMVAVVSTITALLWVRNRRRDNGTKQELTSMVKMKSLPI